MATIHLIGCDGRMAAAVPASCAAVFCAERLRPQLSGFAGALLPISPLAEALSGIETRLAAGEDIGVLVGGDPLFFGIGRRLIERFGRERLTILPACTSLQLLCARLAVPWDDLALVSLHGRRPGSVAMEILRHRRVAVFTDRELTPAAIAGELVGYFSALGAPGLAARIGMHVGERLGSGDERLLSASAVELVDRRFSEPNLLLIECDLPPAENCFGLSEEEIGHSRGLITKDEVRAVALHQLRLPEAGTFWDVGGGSGSVSLEAAAVQPGLAVYTVERQPAELAHIRANILRHHRYAILPVAGEAPAALVGLPDPDRVFIGGSGGRLPEIVAAASARLRPGGRVVINAVTAVTAALAPQLLAGHGFAVRTATVAVHRYREGGEQELNPITIVTGQR
ncbi:MAG: precorrin-6y C5,15-methyltransferase (decarboxylating) subunit CbiE [Thermodesulfobacteriota bacterium]